MDMSTALVERKTLQKKYFEEHQQQPDIHRLHMK